MNQEAFLALLRAGLWEKDVQLSIFGDIDYHIIYKLAEEQSVVGLVAAGLEHVTDTKIPKDIILQFVGMTLQIEQRNKEMNEFVAKLIKRLSRANIFTLVVKGQGVAQCYEKPLWRASGDVDLLLEAENYERAKKELYPIAYDIQDENKRTKHMPMKIMGIDVELHGMMPFSLSTKAHRINSGVVAGSLNNGEVSIWEVNNTKVYIPNPNNHIYLVFTHYLLHFFIEGVGLRQICDWCRMLWTYREDIDIELLEYRLREAGLMTEWQAFSALAVNYLGMPIEVMPFHKDRFNKKGEKVLQLIFNSGNFGHNKDLSYRTKYRGFLYNIVSFYRRFCDFTGMTTIFPLDSSKFLVGYLIGKIKGKAINI